MPAEPSRPVLLRARLQEAMQRGGLARLYVGSPVELIAGMCLLTSGANRAVGMAPSQPCDHCEGPTNFKTEIQPLGTEPGHRVFWCDACKRYTWTMWRISQQQEQPQR